ncbi:WhiB family transcriptional regulator [Streptomyces sp. NPDC005706]|uniref:WhiB family transcriptional regulator n=1 Tax=Streptomyces sp. NPDC005706 TaxID=3157169 RepID=UPI0033FF9F2D
MQGALVLASPTQCRPWWERSRPEQKRTASVSAEEQAWEARRACRTTDPDELFVDSAAQNRARSSARLSGAHRVPYLRIDRRTPYGVWGGMTDRERRALLRRRPTVTSWRSLLETARAEHDQRASRGSGERWNDAG